MLLVAQPTEVLLLKEGISGAVEVLLLHQDTAGAVEDCDPRVEPVSAKLVGPVGLDVVDDKVAVLQDPLGLDVELCDVGHHLGATVADEATDLARR